MPIWTVEYYEQQSGSQPAEVFEDGLVQTYPALRGKLISIARAMVAAGPQHLGGGYVQVCHGYAGLWEMRAISSRTLARELFGLDGSRIVLLHGYVKRTGQPASIPDLKMAAAYWRDYQATRRISPEATNPTAVPDDEQTTNQVHLKGDTT